jgi:hypothetical protein
MDIVYLLGILALFGATVALVAGCRKLGGPQS